MNVLHYSFSLSACPKCHLLICKHTSLANLNMNLNEKENISQEHLTNGTNVYLFPSTIHNHRYSWTTNESLNTMKNFLTNNETICENIPFSNEKILNSSLILTPKQNSIIQTDYHLTNIKSLFSPIFILWIFLLILSFLITNTIDIVLIYIYYHTNYLYLMIFLMTIFICDFILWIIELNHRIFYLLLIPFNIRLYFLHQLLEFLIILFDKNIDKQIFRIRKDKLYQKLTLFYLLHTGFLTLVNLYIYLNHLIKFISNSESISIYFENIFSNTLQISSSIPYSSLFILISILYYIIINYSVISTLLTYKKYSFFIILIRLCLIIPRIYTFIFVFYLNNLWLIICLFIIHFILIFILLFNQLKLKTKQKKIFLQFIFSLITNQSIKPISINLLIFIENISIYFYQFYSNQLTLYLSIFILMEILGFIFHILLKYIQYEKKTRKQKCII